MAAPASATQARQPAQATFRQPSALLEVTAAALTPAATLGFFRVFADGGDTRALVGFSLVSTLLAVALRRLRVPLWGATLLSTAVLWAVLVQRYAPGTAAYGIWPTGGTVDAISELIAEGAVDFREERALAPGTDAFMASGTIAVWLSAFLTDWGALRLRLAFEAVLPAAILFIFTTVLGVDANRWSSTMIMVIAIGVWALAQRATRLSESGRWLRADRVRGPASIVPGAAVLGVIALIAGWVAGPNLPGWGEPEIIKYRAISNPDREVISPYVSIEARLVEQRDQLLFQVTSEEPSYWRLAGLDTYQNGVWEVNRDFESRTGPLPGAAKVGTELEQSFQIEALGEIWLPAAFTPAAISAFEGADPIDVSWNADTSSLTVTGDRDSNAALRYEVVSVVSDHSPGALSTASSAIPEVVAESYLALPEDLTSEVATEAGIATANATNRFEQMLALQDYFRDFDYSLELSPRTGDPIEQFLDERVGFCQQFAGTFALMARTLGAPARVAVGFTWGEPDPENPDTYLVTGRQAHAWPEVYFGDLGWVAFEPTPGRGLPNASYTNVSARQDSEVQPTLDADSGDAEESTTPTTFDPAQFEPSLPDFDQGQPGQGGSGSGGGPNWGPFQIVLVIAALTLGLAVGAGAVIRRFMASPGQPQAEVDRDWAYTSAWIERITGMRRRASETRLEFAVRAAENRRVGSDDLIELATLATEARYAPSISPHAADQARELSERIVSDLREQRTPYQQVKDQLDPRWLYRQLRASRLLRSQSDQSTTDESRQKDGESQLVP